ncbi:MAG TPA: peptidoglycan DD-metalloendopeptidase family protein [Candidatus Paceibacterota bacterium]
MHYKSKYKLLAANCLLLFLTIFSVTHALAIDELQRLIDQKKQEKVQLEEENKKLTEQINVQEEQAKTLSSNIKVLDQNAKKLGNDIKTTKTDISKTQYEIQQLGLKISSAEQKISVGKKAVAELIRQISETDKISIVENFLSDKTLADVWDEVEAAKKINDNLGDHIDALFQARADLTDRQNESKQKKNELVSSQNNLTVQQKIVLENQAAKTKLLVDTKSLESAYQKQLQANIERGRQIEQEQFDYESQLQIAIDPSKLPAERPGVLSWPIIPHVVTQKFGATVSAKRLYVSGSHNGVDFRATVGTPVKAALSGTVTATGNTDDQKGCYSYGRWILIRHGNGLSSLYAHLSAFRVTQGQTVSTGEIIGFSGGYPGANGSGFSTGPHLHLGLFATEGVRVERYASSKFCKNVSIPTAPLRGYLDPLAYLPTPY